MKRSSHFISSVSYDTECRFIVSATVHSNENETIGKSASLSRQKIVRHIMAGFLYSTIINVVSENDWELDGRVEPVIVEGVLYLKTTESKTDRDDFGSVPQL